MISLKGSVPEPEILDDQDQVSGDLLPGLASPSLPPSPFEERFPRGGGQEPSPEDFNSSFQFVGIGGCSLVPR